MLEMLSKVHRLRFNGSGSATHLACLRRDAGRFVDPMRVKLPRGRSLEGAVMASFEKERDRLDVQMNNRGSAARVSEAAGVTPQARQVSR